MTDRTELLVRLERCYDAIPRVDGALAEELGALVLFIPDGPGWPYYARPRPGATAVTAADIEAVRARQRELGLPDAFEWVHEVTPAMLDAARAAGLPVRLIPLMVLDPDALPGAATLTDVETIVLDPDAPDFADRYALSDAVARLGFAEPGDPDRVAGTAGSDPGRVAGTAGSDPGRVAGTAGSDPDRVAGTAQRDTTAAETAADPAAIRRAAAAIQAGRRVHVVAATAADGIVATGALQLAAGCAEVVGVATLPAARRRGLGSAVSAALARHALDRRAEIVFLSAASPEVGRMYGRIGFRRIGTACIAGSAPG